MKVFSEVVFGRTGQIDRRPDDYFHRDRLSVLSTQTTALLKQKGKVFSFAHTASIVSSHQFEKYLSVFGGYCPAVNEGLRTFLLKKQPDSCETDIATLSALLPSPLCRILPYHSCVISTFFWVPPNFEAAAIQKQPNIIFYL